MTLFVLYLEQGVRHIVEGIDHMALVVAMTLGTMTAGAIAWRQLAILVTAFTLGHSITLGTTVFGLQPAWPLFIPAVETTIALSMIYTAVSALRGKSGAAAVYFGIGIVHGFGFSLMLSRILGPDSPQLVWSLFSFNLGIELGQLMIVVATGVVSFGVQTVLGARVERGVHVAVLVAISVLALFYVVTRAGLMA
ncbi:HupE/UreJ family protein [Tateyamaria sp. SN3-11]|uniref:HupE/UreJ family protein n=1 Tax=Tateyamaria sp. SN3-11 TaxID=3092147 RepID=UPI0039E85D1F